MTASVGEDLESQCTRCDETTWHVVVAKVGDRIAKVECKQCGAQHRFRPPPGAAPPARVRATPRRAAAKEPRAAEPAETAAPPSFDPARPPRPYRASEAYQAGDRVVHPSFGIGIVAGPSGPGRVAVHFPSGVRILAQAKEPSKLPARHEALLARDGAAAGLPAGYTSDAPPRRPAE